MKKEVLKLGLGVDISSSDLDCNLSTIDTLQQVKIKATRRFKNSKAGIAALIKWLSNYAKKIPVRLQVLVEATGVYHENLVYALSQHGFNVSVILPNKAKKYLESLGHKSKNDKIDAKGLAQMCVERSLPLWQAPGESMYLLRCICRELTGLQHKKTMINNQLHALEHAYMRNKNTVKRLNQQLRLVEKQIESVKQDIVDTVENEAELKRKVENITAIKGVGLQTVATIIAETNGFVLFENQAQLVSYAGYDVVENQSGKRHGKTRISKKGNSHIRAALHFAALNVVRHDVNPFSSFHQRLIEKGKLKMQGYVAVQKKLLIMMWALWRKDEKFMKNYQESTKSEMANQQEKQKVTSGNQEAKYPLSVAPTGAKKQPLPREMAAQDELPLN